MPSTEITTLVVLLSLSLILNVVFLIWIRPRPHKRKLDLSAQDLIHDLTRRGVAVLKVEVIDAQNLMLRSPRG